MKKLIESTRPEIVFNMVESVYGEGALAPIAPAMLEKLRVQFTGVTSATMACLGDKPFAKRILQAANCPRPIGPSRLISRTRGRPQIHRQIVDEDASLGLDDAAVVVGRAAAKARADMCAGKYGGRWFAERYIEGREFNVAVLEEEGGPRVLPIAEMRFEDWAKDRPRIVGYAAKWDDASKDSTNTVRDFEWSKKEPALYNALCDHAKAAWNAVRFARFRARRFSQQCARARADFGNQSQSLPRTARRFRGGGGAGRNGLCGPH